MTTLAEVGEKLDTEKDSPSTISSVREALHNFLDYTSAHGCGRLAASRSLFWTLFWIVMCICAHIAFYYHASILINGYLQKETRTKISMFSKKKLDFPVITICNRNMLRKSKITPEMKKEIDALLNTTLELSQKSSGNNLNTSTAFPHPNQRHHSQVKADSFRDVWSRLSKNKLVEMGHQLDDMLLDCSFGGQNCRTINDLKTWRHIWIEGVGNCYMFNRALDVSSTQTKPHAQIFQGHEFGLNMVLNIEQGEFLDGLTDVAGLRLFIGAHGEMPFPSFQSINIAPGESTNIQILMIRRKRLDPLENNSCRSSTALDPSNIYNQHNMSYSKMACDVSCLSYMQQSACKCSRFYFTHNGSNNCNSSDPDLAQCLSNVHEKFLHGACEKSCPRPCNEVTFNKVVSTSVWPAHHYEDYLLKFIKHRTDKKIDNHHLRGNILDLHIYYTDMDYKMVQDVIKYKFEDLMSDVGGQMGMWIGLSALTIAEVVELFWIIISHLIAARRKKTKPRHSKVFVQSASTT